MSTRKEEKKETLEEESGSYNESTEEEEGDERGSNENVSHQRLESSSQQQKLSSITEPNERINHEMDSKKYSTKNSISREIYKLMDSNLRIQLMSEFEVSRLDASTRRHLFWKEKEANHYFLYDLENEKLVYEYEDGVEIESYLSDSNDEIVSLKSLKRQKKVQFSLDNMRVRFEDGDFIEEYTRKGWWVFGVYVKSKSKAVVKEVTKKGVKVVKEIEYKEHFDNLIEFKNGSKFKEYFQNLDSMHLSIAYIYNEEEKVSSCCFRTNCANSQSLAIELNQQSYLNEQSSNSETTESSVATKTSNLVQDISKQLSDAQEKNNRLANEFESYKNEIIQLNSQMTEEMQNVKTVEELNEQLTLSLSNKNELIIDSQSAQTEIIKLNSEIAVNLEYFKRVEQRKKSLKEAQEEKEQLNKEIKLLDEEILSLRNKHSAELKVIKSETNIKSKKIKKVITNKSYDYSNDMLILNNKLVKDLEYFKQVEDINEKLQVALNQKEQLLNQINKFEVEVEIETNRISEENTKEIQVKEQQTEEALKAQAEISTQIQKCKDEITTLNDEIKRDQNDLNKLKETKKELKTLVHKETKTSSVKSNQIELINEKLQAALNQKEQLVNQINKIKVEIETNTIAEENLQKEQVKEQQIEEVLKAQAEIRTQIQKCKDEITTLNDEIKRDQNELKKLKETKKQLKTLVQKENKTSSTNEEAKLDLSDFITEKKTILNEVHKCKKEIISLNAKIQEDMSKLETIETTNKQLTMTLAEKEQIIKDIQKKKQQVLELRNQHSIEFERLRAIEEKNEKLCSIISDREHLIKEIQNYKAEFQQLTEQLRLDKKQLKKANQTESLSQQIDNEELIQLIHDFRSEISKLDEKVSNEIIQFDSIEESSDEVTIVITEKTKLKKEIQSFKQEINELTAQTSMVLESLKSVQNINENLTQVLSSRHLLAIEIENYKNEILKMNSEISNRATAKINADVNLEVESTESIPIKEDIIENTEICEFKNKISKLNIDLAILVENLEPFNKIKEEIKQVIDEKQQLTTDIDNYRQQIIETNQQLSVYTQDETEKLKESKTKLETALKANKQLELSIKYIKQEIERLNSEYQTETSQVGKLDETKEELSENLKDNIEMSEQVHNQVNETSQINIEFKTSEQYFRELEEINAKLTKTVCEKGNLLDELQINSNYFNSEQTLKLNQNNSTHTSQETEIEIISDKKEKKANDIKVFKEELKRLKTLTIKTNYQEQASELKEKLIILTTDIKKIESDIQTYKKEITTLKSQQQEHTVRIKEFEQLESDVKEVLANNQNLRLQIQSLKEQKIKLINEFTTEIEHIRALKNVENQAEVTVVEETITTNKGDVKIRLDYNLKEINTIKSKLDIILEENAKLKAEYEQRLKSVSNKTAKGTLTRSQSVQKINLNRAENEKKTTELKSELESFKQDLLKLKAQISEGKQALKAAKQTEVSVVEDKEVTVVEDKEVVNTRLDNLKEINEIQSKLDVILQENAKLRAEYEQKKTSVSNKTTKETLIHQKNDLNKVENEKTAELKAELESFKQDLSKLKVQISESRQALKVAKQTENETNTKYIDLIAEKTTKIDKITVIKTDFDQQNVITEINKYREEISKLAKLYTENRDRFKVVKETNKKITAEISAKEELITEIYNKELFELNEQIQADSKHLQIDTEVTNKIQSALNDKETLVQDIQTYRNEIFKLQNQHSSNVAILKVIQEGNQKLSASFQDKTQLINKIKSYQQDIAKLNISTQESVLSSSESTESIKEEANNESTTKSTEKESKTANIEILNNEISAINEQLSNDITQFNDIEKLNEQLFISIC